MSLLPCQKDRSPKRNSVSPGNPEKSPLINNLYFDSDNQIDCSVCKEDFVLEESVIELPCMHLYHDDCINPWLKVNGTCPVW